MKYKSFQDIPPFIQYGSYEIDVGFKYLETQLGHYREDVGLDLDPDFQRGHVWTEARQVAYVEYCLRGGTASRTLLWNCHDWYESTGLHPVVLVDGKQRLEAVRKFMRDDLVVFGNRYSQFEGKLRLVNDRFRFNVNGLKTRREVLQWYLELNSGGVVHTKQELDKVRCMLDKER